MTKKKKQILWIGGGILLLIAVLASILIIEGCDDGKDLFSSRFPEDGVEASLKLAGRGYSVDVKEQPATLSSLQSDAASMYDLTFFGAMTAYIEASDSEDGSLQAQIFYFEYEQDAKTLYDAMKADWQYKDEEGQIRYQGNAVYMGYGEALDALEN